MKYYLNKIVCMNPYDYNQIIFLLNTSDYFNSVDKQTHLKILDKQNLSELKLLIYLI